MPRLTNANPRYRRHRPSGQAVVTLDGHDHYLGIYGSKISRLEYDRLVGQWIANGRRSPTVAATVPDLTIVELTAAYMQHAATYYRDADGNPTSELSALKLPLGVLVRLYGRTPAAAFGPLAMEAVRNEMIAKGWGRASINAHVGRLRRMFKWAVARELLPVTVHQSLTTVAGLRAGRTAARETGAIKPVPEAAVEATLPFLSPTVAAMVRVQLLTGARPGEVCSMRTGDLDRSGDVWRYRPAKHKTQHHGHSREIQIGPKAQAVLIPFLRTDPTAFLFSPAEADAAHRAKRSAARRTPASCGNVPGSNRKQAEEDAGDPLFRRRLSASRRPGLRRRVPGAQTAGPPQGRDADRMAGQADARAAGHPCRLATRASLEPAPPAAHRRHRHPSPIRPGGRADRPRPPDALGDPDLRREARRHGETGRRPDRVNRWATVARFECQGTRSPCGPGRDFGHEPPRRYRSARTSPR